MGQAIDIQTDHCWAKPHPSGLRLGSQNVQSSVASSPNRRRIPDRDDASASAVHDNTALPGWQPSPDPGSAGSSALGPPRRAKQQSSGKRLSLLRDPPRPTPRRLMTELANAGVIGNDTDDLRTDAVGRPAPTSTPRPTHHLVSTFNLKLNMMVRL